MPMEMGWGDFEETVLIWKFQSRWSGDEFYAHMRLLNEFCASKPQGIALIVDMRGSHTTPNNLTSLIRQSVRIQPTNISQTIVISQTTFWGKLLDIVQKSGFVRLTIPVSFAKTVDEAYQRLGLDSAP